MKLQTKVKITQDFQKLDENSVISGLGSCFSLRILKELHSLGLNGAINPNGIVYNSFSIMESLKRCSEKLFYTEDEFFKHNGLWHSWQHHGSFSSPDKKAALEKMNKSLANFAEFLEKSSVLIITYSSSVVYIYEEKIIANCHKVPGKKFSKRVLSVQENIKYMMEAVKEIRKINSKCKIILTLSPVRHYPGNLELNSLSKANIRSAISEISEGHNIYYFPSYEIMMDELRDYRFYNEDMLHPSSLAEKIILERFLNWTFTENAQNFFTSKNRKLKRLNHKKRKV